MKFEKLPLLDIFNSLRSRHGLPLGVEEYLVFLRSLEGGFGINNRQELEQLCCMLWAKTEEESYLIRWLFELMWKQVESAPTNSNINIPETSENSPDIESSKVNETNILYQQEIPATQEYISDNQLQNLENTLSVAMQPVQPAQVSQNNPKDRKNKLARYMLLTEYFPVSKRQMKQCWRSLRRSVRQGAATELDVEATVAKIGREGNYLQPVLIPPRINQSDLILLIDQEGSMVPFHDLSRQLVETARRGGKLRTTNVFYFHDYPDQYLYQNPALIDAKPISDLLREIEKQSAILIVSDAGAARGNFDQERINKTKMWIEQLHRSVRHFAWLNPVPDELWRQTTSEEIARFVPMFEMNPQGMKAAISVLQGKFISKNSFLEIAQVTSNKKAIVDAVVQTKNIYNFNNNFKRNLVSVSLTEKELEVLPLIIQGYDDALIAEKLSIKLNTISRYRKNILRKLSLNISTSIQVTDLRLNL